MSDEKRKTALVVGGSRGIGRAIAIRLARSGFNICLTYHSNTKAAEDARTLVTAEGVECELFSFDISDTAKSREILEARFENSPPYVVVFNAGIARDNLMMWMTEDEWKSVTQTNLDGFYNAIRPILFPMLSEKQGRIIVISSTSGQMGQAGQVNYSASKAGLIGAAKALAREIGKKKILVNVVAPGVIETEMTEDLPKDKILPLIPLNCFGKVEDVAGLVNFLAGDESTYIHGQVIGVNGGLAM